jgi:hypothetical protein
VRRTHLEQGSRWLRWVLVKAAVSGPYDPALRSFFGRIARRRGVRFALPEAPDPVFYALREENGPFPVVGWTSDAWSSRARVRHGFLSTAIKLMPQCA